MNFKIPPDVRLVDNDFCCSCTGGGELKIPDHVRLALTEARQTIIDLRQHSRVSAASLHQPCTSHVDLRINAPTILLAKLYKSRMYTLNFAVWLMLVLRQHMESSLANEQHLRTEAENKMAAQRDQIQVRAP